MERKKLDMSCFTMDVCFLYPANMPSNNTHEKYSSTCSQESRDDHHPFFLRCSVIPQRWTSNKGDQTFEHFENIWF